jgi:activator of HSP90 ATPase
MPTIATPQPSRRRIMTAGAAAAGVISVGANGFGTNAFGADDGVTHDAEAIRQTPQFRARRARVYRALMSADQFDRVTQLSGVMQSSARPSMQAATTISPLEGGAFALFGGYITGRHIELVPDTRIVQAWRVGSWEPGVFSIARFQLVDHDGGTRIIFDHTGFPTGRGEHLASGWHQHYWEPLAKYLS